jgi:hypothetical protein
MREFSRERKEGEGVRLGVSLSSQAITSEFGLITSRSRKCYLPGNFSLG